MTDSLILSKREFAARHGWSPSYVTKLAGQSRLILAPDGKRVDVHATEALIQKTADPVRQPVADRHLEQRVDKALSELPSEAVEIPMPASGGEYFSADGTPNFQRSKAWAEYNRSEILKDDLLKSRGQLVNKAAVEHAAFATGRMLRDLLFGLPKQISPELASLSNSWEVERCLTAGIRRVLEDAERVSASDLEHVINPPS
jgi:hypothetical protein